MKRIAVAVALLILIGGAFYVINSMASDTMSEELDAILAPKFKEAGAAYGDLKVHPASGTISFNDVTAAEGEFSASVVSVQSTFEDLLAAAQGTPEYLHGLTIHVEDLTATDGEESVTLDRGDLKLDALIDIQKLQQDPEEYLMEFFQQDDILLDVSTSGFSSNVRDISDELGLPSPLMRLDELDLLLEKEGESGEFAITMDSPDFGEAQIRVKGNESELSSFDIALTDFFLPIDDQVKMNFGQATFNMAGAMPIEELVENDGYWEDLLMSGTSIEWTATVEDGVIEGPAMSDSGLPNDRLTIAALEHTFEYTGQKLLAHADFESNMSDGEFDVDLTIFSLEPPNVNAEALEIELQDVHPTLSKMLVLSPLRPSGENGYTFSFSGPITDLLSAL